MFNAAWCWGDVRAAVYQGGPQNWEEDFRQKELIGTKL